MWARRAYYGLVRMIDRLAGQVFDVVAERQDTMVIHVSDHCEALGERGLWWKGTFYEESVSVPLIMRGPGVPARVVDRRVVGLTDLTATILDLAGADALPGQSGRSLLDSGEWENTATSSYYGGLMNIQTGALQHPMLRRNSLKLCYYDGAAPTLHDLRADPDELTDLADDMPDTFEQMMSELMRGWNPRSIASQQEINLARVAVLRDWVKTVRPEERLRWCDPKPQRSRYIG